MPIPAAAAAQLDVDSDLGEHCDADLRFLSPDGGVVANDGVATGDQVANVEADQDDERPDDCECGELHGFIDLPCFPCYRDGFETPADVEGED